MELVLCLIMTDLCAVTKENTTIIYIKNDYKTNKELFPGYEY